jgi:uncharacterized membrane protein
LSLGWKLFAVFVGFCALMSVVMYMAFRERKLGQSMAEDDRAGQQASDARVLAVVFSAAIGGMLLTLLVAWLVFL